MGEKLPGILVRLRSANCHARPSLLALTLPLIVAMVGCSTALPWRVSRISNQADENGLPLVARSAVPPNPAEPNSTSYLTSASYVNARPPLTPLGPPGIAAPATASASVPRQSPQPGIRQAAQVEDKSQVLPAPRTLPTTMPVGLTFNQAINLTLVADPKIRAGLESISQANADLKTSSLLPNPTVFVDGIFLPLSPLSAATPGGPPQLDAQLNFPIDWFLFGKRAAAMVSATLGVRQSEADYADLVRQRVRDTALAYYDVVEAKALLDLAKQDTENLVKLEAATKKAVDAGGRPMVDLNRVRLDLLKSQQDLREAEATLAINKAKLRSFFGRTDTDLSFDVADNLDTPVTDLPLTVDEAFAQARENRPDIQSLRWQVYKARANVVVEKRKAFPQITPQFGYTRQYQGALGNPDWDSWTVTLTTTVPFFDRNQGNRMKAQSVAAQNFFNWQVGEVDLREEIEEAVQDLHKSYKNAMSVAQEQLKLAAEVRDSITNAFNIGGRPLIDVLDAETSYRETYRAYINSRAEYWRAVYRFSSAMGQQVLQQ